ncbi:MAG: hypothetical protein A2289_17935 [Deltaproteobacteria bacterium RIFOXYA12_FULL_58_15]|nr:MAG: hypothetical protein A2289_17935 [Deltaproteobacteria bacterium RIFOXYA12_FULL_58_15]OGR09058.1 MAG: hypothetical protein A2341_25845 [Deltaproteobacteria bacterium RIFOXYB12_FULL_58_9]
MAHTDSKYLYLWRRLERVVNALSESGRKDEADYYIADFFLTFEEIDELERHVEIAERGAKEEGLI